MNETGKSLFESITSKILSKFEPKTGAVKYDIIFGHKFQAILLYQPTYCSQCNNLIYGLNGRSCKLCQLVSHRDCLLRVKCRCIKKNDYDTSKPQTENRRKIAHKLHGKFFKKPTFCNHCGTLIADLVPHDEFPFFKHGLECNLLDGGCGLTIHFNCLDKIRNECLESKREDEIEAENFKQSCIIDAKRNGRLIDKEFNYNNNGKISLDDFEPIKLIDRGSFGDIFQVKWCKSPSKHLALKVIKKTNIVVASDPRSVLTEMKVLKFARNHPFLIKIHCCFQTLDRLYFLMEYVEGKNLAQFTIERCQKFSENVSKFYGSEIFLAIKHLHQARIIHRDLKLENVILDRAGHCKLIDFGLSKQLNVEEKFKTRTFCGTPRYISPEVIKELAYDYSVDWWAFGVALFEMLLGYSPFVNNFQDEEEIYSNILDENEQPLAEVKDFLSREALNLLSKLLERDHTKRIDCHGIGNHQFLNLMDQNGQDFESRETQWEALLDKRIKAPKLSVNFDDKNNLSDERDLKMFKEFSKRSNLDSKQLEDIPQEEFDDFSYFSQSFEDALDEPLIRF